LWTCGGVSRLFDVEYALRIEFQVYLYTIHGVCKSYVIDCSSPSCFTEHSFAALPTLLYVE
jgi:hypothetical protein